jgi:hypothetical protein
MKAAFLVLVLILLTCLYAYQIYTKSRERNAERAAKVSTQQQIAEERQLNQTRKAAMEASLSKLKLTTILLGEKPLAIIDKKEFSEGDPVFVPGVSGRLEIKKIQDGEVLISTPYHPDGYPIRIHVEKSVGLSSP